MESSAKPVQPSLLIVWWSMTDATRQLADAAAVAARQESGVRIISKRCDQAGADDVLSASGYLFATPENLASMAGMMKDFFDRTYYPALDRIAGRPYATMISAGSDGQGAARQLARIALGWRLRPVVDPLIIITGAQTPEAILARKQVDAASLDKASELGATLAAGLAMGIW